MCRKNGGSYLSYAPVSVVEKLKEMNCVTTKTSRNKGCKHSKLNIEEAYIRKTKISVQPSKNHAKWADEENIDWDEADFDLWRLELSGIY